MNPRPAAVHLELLILGFDVRSFAPGHDVGQVGVSAQSEQQQHAFPAVDARVADHHQHEEPGNDDHERNVGVDQITRDLERAGQRRHAQNQQNVRDIAAHDVADRQPLFAVERRNDRDGGFGRGRPERDDRQSDDQRRYAEPSGESRRAAHHEFPATGENHQPNQQQQRIR